MSIEKTTVQHRKFIVKAGMTAEDVKKSKDATALQKKYANVFDSDGQKGFSQKEADLFNATTFSEKADGSVMFWTRQKDGTKKGVKFSGNIDEMNYSVKSDVKPYITTKKVVKNVVKQPKQEEVSFEDSKWSGHQIAKLTGDNDFTDWLQDKDKVCTDGKDDGKIGFWEGTKSLAKGLIGGIPKAMINHPVTTAVTLGIGAAATALTGGAILPVLGAIGVASGVGMAGYGTYKAATAKTDGEAKQALETLGMGVTTTVLSSAGAGKALESAAKAGVKSAEVAENANAFTKTIQLFKSIPEALKVSGHNAKNVYTMATSNTKTLLDGTKQVYKKDGTIYEYNKKGEIVAEMHPDGTRIDNYTKYNCENGNFIKTTLKDGTYKVVNKTNGKIIEVKLANGSIKSELNRYNDIDGNFTRTTLEDGTFSVYDNKNKIFLEKNSAPEVDMMPNKFHYDNGSLKIKYVNDYATGKYPEGYAISKEYYPNGQLKEECIRINGDSYCEYLRDSGTGSVGDYEYYAEYKDVALVKCYDQTGKLIRQYNDKKYIGAIEKKITTNYMGNY